MFGMLMNNYYLVRDNMRMCVICDIISFFAYIICPCDITLFTFIFTFIVLISGSCVNAVMISKNTNWYYYEKSMPYGVKKIVLSRYLNLFIFSAISLAIVLITGKLNECITGTDFFNHVIDIQGMKTINVNKMIRTLFIELQLVNILYYPLFYVLKTEKVDIVILMSIGVGTVITLIFLPLSIPYLILVFLGLYIISYILSCLLVSIKKDK